MRGVLKRSNQAGWKLDRYTQWGLFPEHERLGAAWSSAPVDVTSRLERGITFGREGSRYTTYLWEVVT